MVIGAAGLHDKPGSNRRIWLDPRLQGRGLMTEAGAAMTRFRFENFGRAILRVPKAVANEASRRISWRQGMRAIASDERDDVSGRFATAIGELTAEDWRRRDP